jgi:hypothetical protein
VEIEMHVSNRATCASKMRELVPISRETPGSVIESDVSDEEKRETVSTVVRKEVDFRHKDFEIMDNAHSVVSTIYIRIHIFI